MVEASPLLDVWEGAPALPSKAYDPAACVVDLPRRFPSDYCCPRCGLAWAGNPKPNPEEVPE